LRYCSIGHLRPLQPIISAFHKKEKSIGPDYAPGLIAGHDPAGMGWERQGVLLAGLGKLQRALIEHIERDGRAAQVDRNSNRGALETDLLDLSNEPILATAVSQPQFFGPQHEGDRGAITLGN